MERVYLGLDFVVAVQEIPGEAVTDDQVARGKVRARRQIDIGGNSPKLGARGHGSGKRRGRIELDRLCGQAALSTGVDGPNLLSPLFARQLRGGFQHLARLSRFALRSRAGGLLSQSRQAGVFLLIDLQEKRLRFGIGSFEPGGEPSVQGAIHQGIADEEHEDQREKRDGHCAKDHLGPEPRTQLLGLVFGQEPNQRARQHQAEHQEAHDEERRKGVEDDDLVPGAEREGRGDGAESDDSSHKKGQEDPAQRQP